MKPCFVVSVFTPKKYKLNGLWYGSENAKTGIVFLHGLTSSAFAMQDLLSSLANDEVAVLALNNRGHDKIAYVKRINKQRKSGYKSEEMGEAHEVFTDCVDDIQGAVNFLQGKGVKNIYLLGHSSGCQKSIYYLSQRGKQKLIRGVILLCPLSDYAWTTKKEDGAKLKQVTEYARKLVKQNKPHELLPINIWPEIHDAQRFLSLYTKDSQEEIFRYWDAKEPPKTLQKVKTPMLIIFGGQDEYRDRPIKRIAKWFGQQSKSAALSVKIAETAMHNLKGSERQVERWIKAFIGKAK